MQAHITSSQPASKRMATSLAMVDTNDDNAPYLQFRPVERIPLGDDEDEAVLFAPVRSSSHPVRSTSANGSAPHASANTEALDHKPDAAAWSELRRSSTPVDSWSAHRRTQDTYGENRVDHAGASWDGDQKPRTPRSSTIDQRQLERLALPRDEKGTRFKPAEPNYGRLLNFTEEEEQRQWRAQQLREGLRPRPRRSSTPKRVVRPAPVANALPLQKEQKTRTRSPVALTAAQQAYFEKMAAPKKSAVSSDMNPTVGPPLRRSVSTTPRLRGSTSTFERLAAPKRNSSVSEEEVPHPHHPRSHSAIGQAMHRQHYEAYLKRIAQPKNPTASHRDAEAAAVYRQYAPPKRYYGGTTSITPLSGSTNSSEFASASQNRATWRKGQVANPSWDSLSRPWEPQKAPPEAPAPLPSDSDERGERVPQQRTYRVTSPPTPRATTPQMTNVTLVEPVTLLPPRPAPPVPNSDGVSLVQSTPAKRTGSKPPIVVRTRRFVPPSDAEDTVGEASLNPSSSDHHQATAATPAPQPVEATRRRSATPHVAAEAAESSHVNAIVPGNKTPRKASADVAPAQALRDATKPSSVLTTTGRAMHSPTSATTTLTMKQLPVETSKQGGSEPRPATHPLAQAKMQPSTPLVVSATNGGDHHSPKPAEEGTAAEEVYVIPLTPSGKKKGKGGRTVVHKIPSTIQRA